MTGTASELSDYDENEPCSLNSFDLFSLWLIKKANTSHLTVANLWKDLPMLKSTNPSISPYDAACSMTEPFMCDGPAISK
jgi:hypothetical protein